MTINNKKLDKLRGNLIIEPSFAIEEPVLGIARRPSSFCDIRCFETSLQNQFAKPVCETECSAADRAVHNSVKHPTGHGRIETFSFVSRRRTHGTRRY
jgi:hypothetical protein